MEQITLDDFKKIDIRIGTITYAERVPKTDKLVVLKVDIGEEQPRQVVAGIGLGYEPENLVGKQIALLANLAPATLRGVESYGMILAASDEKGVSIISADRAVANGSTVK